MSITDATYFENAPTRIPNVVCVDGVAPELSSANNLKLQRCIDRYEPMYLKALLGRDLYNEFANDKDNVKWDGLKAILWDDLTKVSPIANFVFYNYVAENYATYNGSLSIKTTSDNVKEVDANYNQVLAWNDMVYQHETIMQWIADNYKTFTDVNDLCVAQWEELLSQRNTLGI